MISSYAKIRAVSTKLAIAANNKTREAIAKAQTFEPTIDQVTFRNIIRGYPEMQRSGLLKITKFLKPELVPDVIAEGYILNGSAAVEIPVFGAVNVKRQSGIIGDIWLFIGGNLYIKLANKAACGGRSEPMNLSFKEITAVTDEEIVEAMSKVYLTLEFQNFLMNYLEDHNLDIEGNTKK